MKVNNIEIRQAIERKRIPYNELARTIGIHASTLSRWLQIELEGERRERVERAIRSFDL